MTRASAAKLEAEVAAATAATVGAVPEVEDGCDKSTTSTSSIANTSASARMVAMAGALDVAVEVPRCPTSYMNDERKACFPVGLELSSSSSSSSVSSSPPPSVPTLPEDGLGSCEELDGPKPASSSSSQSSFMSSGMLQWPVKAEESHTLATSADEGSVGSDNTLRGGDGGSARAYAASISAASSSLSSLSPSSFAHGVSLSTDHGIAGPSSDTVSSSDSSDKPLRKGKWTAEEEAYTSAIIEDFSKGYVLRPLLSFFLIRLFPGIPPFLSNLFTNCLHVLRANCTTLRAPRFFFFFFFLFFFAYNVYGMPWFVVYLDSCC